MFVRCSERAAGAASVQDGCFSNVTNWGLVLASSHFPGLATRRRGRAVITTTYPNVAQLATVLASCSSAHNRRVVMSVPRPERSQYASGTRLTLIRSGTDLAAGCVN